MPTILLGAILGFSSAAFCAVFGNISATDAVLIYTLTGTLAVLLHLTLQATTPDL